MLTLRLVGKFLGFVIFLPYKNTSKLPDDTEAAYIALRKYVSFKGNYNTTVPPHRRPPLLSGQISEALR